MKTVLGFVSGFVVCAFLFCTLGAGPASDYQNACNAVQAELSAMTWLAGRATKEFNQGKPLNLERIQACELRADYWITILEKFKP